MGGCVDLLEIFRFVGGALRGQRLRSFLSALGVAIGVTAVILLTSLGEGTREYIVGQFTQFGTSIVGINPGKVKTVGIPGVLGGTTHKLTIDDAEALRALLARVEKLAPPRPSAAKTGKGPRLPQKTSRDGYTILFGRSADQNEAILRIADPDDIWLHARGVPGAHVLIRTGGRPEKVPNSTLIEAAAIAGRLSAYRHDGVADVDYTLARYVRKPKSTPPGFVTYTHQKTIRVKL